MSAITVKSPKTKREISVEKEFGESLAQMVDLWGEKVVFEKATSQLSTDLGNAVRRMLNEEKSDADILAFVEQYVPGVIQRTGGTRETIKVVAAKLQALKNDPNADPAEVARLRAKIVAYIEEVRQLEELAGE